MASSISDPLPDRTGPRPPQLSKLQPNPPPSLLFSMLPNALQTRLPKIQSIRCSVSELRGRSMRASSVTAASPGETTPRSSCSSRAGSIGASFRPLSSLDGETLTDDASTYERPLSSSSTLPVFPMSDVDSGINWKYANQGSNLLAQSFQESTAYDISPHERGGLFCRDLYVHALMYLLRALPTDLSTAEILSLRTSLPPTIVDSIEASAVQKEIALYDDANPDDTVASTPSPPPSIVHRVVAAATLQFFILVQFLLPYLRYFIASAYRYERDNRITERLFAKSIDTVDEVGRRTVRLADRVFAMNDGKVGQAINDITLWWVTGITGGIHQGLSEGVVVLRDDGGKGGNVRQRGKVMKKIE